MTIQPNSRVANSEIAIPSGVTVSITQDNYVTVKGAKDTLAFQFNHAVVIAQSDNVLTFTLREATRPANAQAGTARAVLYNMVKGVSEGFTRELKLVGVGYKAQAKSHALELALGYSHPVVMPIPAGLTVETPEPTSIIVKGADKQKVGQFAAEIRAKRPPEPYKGKGVRYANENVKRKEAKKK